MGYENQFLNATAFGFVPTWGGYEINGNPEISQVAVAGLSATLKEGQGLPGTSTRLLISTTTIIATLSSSTIARSPCANRIIGP